MDGKTLALGLCLLAEIPAQTMAQGVFAGSWTVTGAQDAPWVGPKSDLKPHYEAALPGAVRNSGTLYSFEAAPWTGVNPLE